MRPVVDFIAKIAESTAPVLILGESGTGKEMVARAIHARSGRKSGPFIAVNCGALSEGLLESELFGHEKGAFTGAVKDRMGRFELAHQGTIFLDEIGETNDGFQVKLLRVLQRGEFERVGGAQTLHADVRVVAATNRNLKELIRTGGFREDLFYRLNVFPIYVPPLRNRTADIVLLADHFLEKYAKQFAKPIRRLSSGAIDMLMAYHWPGNVRELENCIERAVLVAEGAVIHPYHMPPTLQTAEASGTETRGDLRGLVEAYERDMIRDALKTSRGVVAAAARSLGTTQRILGYKIGKYRIDPKQYVR